MALNITSCNSKKENKKITINDTHITTLDKNDLRNEDTSLGVLYNRLGSMLKFSSISLRPEETEFRIWCINYSYDGGKVIQIRKGSSVWASTFYNFKMNFDEKHDLYSIESSSYESEPLNGWDSFSKRLEGYGVFELKDFSEISNYDFGTGGQSLFLEILRNGNYRKCLFPSYKLNEINVSDVQKLLSVIFLIEREFGYSLFPKPQD